VLLDPSETEAKLGWRAEVGFEETVRRMLRWYDAHGVSAVYSHLRTPATGRA
jgi:UDP-glucose 4-epimerase